MQCSNEITSDRQYFYLIDSQFTIFMLGSFESLKVMMVNFLNCLVLTAIVTQFTLPAFDITIQHPITGKARLKIALNYT